jgi:hypothetical protein
MHQWSQIKAWYVQAGIHDESYVTDLEEEQGALRPFSHGTSGPESTSADLTDEVYLNSYSQRDYISPHNLGGLNPDRSLRIDCTTVKRLFDSCMKNIWVIYPIFDYERMKAQAENFMTGYSPCDVLEETGYCGPPRRPIDHSPDNAIMLLVLALGKLYEHDDFIAYPLDSSPSNSNVVSSAPRASSEPPMNVDIIPGLAYYTEAIHIISELGGKRSLAFAHACILAGLYMGTLGRVLQSWHWIHQATQLVAQFQRKRFEDIMGQPRNKLDANEKMFENEESNSDSQLLVLTFHTCRQLEGDIRAELDTLPASGLVIEDREGRCVKWPGPLLGVSHPGVELALPLFNDSTPDSMPDSMLVLYHFTAQLILRNISDRTHRMLYGELKNEEAVERTAAELWYGLQSWRTRMHARLQWTDDDIPPSDILNAGTRANYYEAAYDINRPFLCKALYPQEGSPQIGPFNYKELVKIKLETDLHEQIWGQYDLGVRCRLCILAALKSTVAFDELFHSSRGPLTRRPKLPNIHGTAAA